MHVYPNPVKHGNGFTLTLPDDAMVRVDIVNALGVVVQTLYATSEKTVNYVAPNITGVYTLRITIEGEGTYTRKLVVK